MPCYHPLTGWHNPEVPTQDGKKKILWFRHPGPYPGMVECKVPCGQCRGCRVARALEWTIRGSHEASLHEANCFITLTFCDGPHQGCRHKRVPNKWRVSLSPKKSNYFQAFMKRLRKHYYGNTKSNVRYIHCGEYGEDFSRPHHHAILFNFSFPDATVWNDKKNLLRSKTLEKLWPYGYSSIGPANFDTIAYVARYVVKKINGKAAPDHYQGREPEYATYSNRPAIALDWYEKFKNTDVFPRDYIVLKGKRLKVPKYYSLKYELTNPEEYGILRDMRIHKALNNPNNHPDRLKAAEQIQLAYDKNKKRSFEKKGTK